MHVDAYGGYNELFKRDDVTEVACLAHVRRRFAGVCKLMSSPIAKEALKRIADRKDGDIDELLPWNFKNATV